MGEYGNLWALEYNGAKLNFPNLGQVLGGLVLYHEMLVTNKCRHLSKKLAEAIHKQYEPVFKQLAAIKDDLDITKTLFAVHVNHKDFSSDYNLWNPDGKASEIILFIYTIEPAFYAENNVACRTRDPKRLNMFGAYSFALSRVLAESENYR